MYTSWRTCKLSLHRIYITKNESMSLMLKLLPFSLFTCALPQQLWPSVLGRLLRKAKAASLNLSRLRICHMLEMQKSGESNSNPSHFIFPGLSCIKKHSKRPLILVDIARDFFIISLHTRNTRQTTSVQKRSSGKKYCPPLLALSNLLSFSFWLWLQRHEQKQQQHNENENGQNKPLPSSSSQVQSPGFALWHEQEKRKNCKKSSVI